MRPKIRVICRVLGPALLLAGAVLILNDMVNSFARSVEPPQSFGHLEMNSITMTFTVRPGSLGLIATGGLLCFFGFVAKNQMKPPVS